MKPLRYLILLLVLILAYSCTEEIPGPPKGPGVIVLDGDSRTDGWNCSYRYPYINLLSLADSCQITKVSDGGNTTDSLIRRAEAVVDPLYTDTAKYNIVVVWAGVNDLAVQNKSDREVYNNLATYCQNRKLAGWSVLVCTEVSMKGVGTNGMCDRERDTLNQWLRRDWNAFADALIDLGGDYRIGSINAYVDTTYFCDGIHLTNRGTEVVAGLISQGINQVAAK